MTSTHPTSQANPLPLSYKRRIPLSQTVGPYLLKTAENSEELRAVLRLRYEVFYQELLKRENEMHLDLDQFDFDSDHLVIWDKKKRCVCGYLPAAILKVYRSFFMRRQNLILILFLQSPETKVEMGRVCIRKEYRSRRIIGLLWKGVFDYGASVGAQHLFGCSSLAVPSYETLERIVQYLSENNHSLTDFEIKPKEGFTFKKEDLPNTTAPTDEVLPPLVLSYLNGGARLAPSPAYDRDFKCLDFFTLLDLKKISSTYQRKFL